MNEVPISLVGVTIEAPVNRLHREARAAHQAWLADPTSEDKKREYGHRLKALAKEVGNREWLTHARALLNEVVDE